MQDKNKRIVIVDSYSTGYKCGKNTIKTVFRFYFFPKIPAETGAFTGCLFLYLELLVFPERFFELALEHF